ncbi:MAG: N-acetyltransferase [Gammaproteobacteria bacterium]|nr:N-acetyltransferase [Gammaproteobacteria bacterium]
MIRPVSCADAEAVAAIYNHYIEHTTVTFEEQPVTIAAMAERIDQSNADNLLWMVAEEQDEEVVGYAYTSKWQGRCAYRHSLEVTVYLSPNATGKAWGTRLYEVLFEKLKQGTTHALIAGISLPNDASIALHEKFGMTKAGHFNEVGFKFGQWVDVGYWQITLT